MVVGSSPVAVTKPSDFRTVSKKEFLGIQATPECGLSLKRVRDMTKTYRQMHGVDNYSQLSLIIWPVWVNRLSVSLRTKCLCVRVHLQLLKL